MAYTPHATALILNLLVGGVPKAEPIPGYLMFDGVDGQVEVPNHSAFSVATTGQLTVEAWMRPDGWTLPTACLGPDTPSYVHSSPYFAATEDRTGSTPSLRYVHWLGKGEGSGPSAQQEWAFRIYSCDHVQSAAGQEEHRAGRISFYIFNLFSQTGQNEGVGSYYQPGFGEFLNEPLWRPDQWIHVVGLAMASGHTYTWTGDSRSAIGMPLARTFRIQEIQRVYVPPTHFRVNNLSSLLRLALHH